MIRFEARAGSWLTIILILKSRSESARAKKWDDLLVIDYEHGDRIDCVFVIS